jgi:RNA polymerase sigma-70 factor (ECF subfamily)
MKPHQEYASAVAPAPDVVDQLVKSHREFLGFLERRLQNRAQAEDLLQEAFVRGLPKLRP